MSIYYLNFLDGLVAIRVRNQNSATRSVGTPTFTARDMPCIANHELKVVVVVDGCADGVIIVNKFGGGDLAVLVDRVEGVQELTACMKVKC